MNCTKLDPRKSFLRLSGTQREDPSLKRRSSWTFVQALNTLLVRGSPPSLSTCGLSFTLTLARLLYTTGEVSEAVRMFLAILRGSPYLSTPPKLDTLALGLEDPGFASEDKLFLDDFRVSFTVCVSHILVNSFLTTFYVQHFQSTEPEQIELLNLKMPIRFSQPKQCKVRFPGEGQFSGSTVWESREEEWKKFQRSSGNTQALAPARKVCANGVMSLSTPRRYFS